MRIQNSKFKIQNYNLKFKVLAKTGHFALFIVTLHFALCTLHLKAVPSAQAFTMSNESWVVEMGNFVSSGGTAKDEKNKIVGGLGQGAVSHAGKNYKVQAGSGGTSGKKSFTFSISEATIDFGKLTATNPVTRTSTITISNPGTNGYQILAYQQSPLINENNFPIYDTTCDNGACTETTAAAWTSNLTYGFGYRCDPIDNISCSVTFATADYYRQFPDISRDEAPQTIIAGQDAATNSKAKVTYKLNIAGTQMPGTYGNTIVYIAAPTY